jgi:hypothetical protein
VVSGQSEDVGYTFQLEGLSNEMTTSNTGHVLPPNYLLRAPGPQQSQRQNQSIHMMVWQSEVVLPEAM